jgi:hypothetical protein
MPRVYTVQKARASKRVRTCRVCGHVIEPGESYRYFEPRYGPAVMYCAEHYPKRSHMTTSKLGPVYDAQDDFDATAYESVEDLQSALQEIASTAEEVASEYEEAISNMPDGTESSPVAEAMQEKIDILQSYAQELESFEPDMETFDEDDARNTAEEEVAGEMLDEMDLDEVRNHLLIDVDEIPELDDDGEAEDPLEGMEAKDIVTQHGDEADYTSRVDARVEEMREAHAEEHGDELDTVRDEATELVAGLEL